MPPFQTRAVAAFDEPWAMVFLPDGQALVTQRGGALLLAISDLVLFNGSIKSFWAYKVA